jgi:hypothetical protein
MQTDFAMQLIPILIILVLIVPAWWAIFRKAGYSGWLGLLMLVPLVNLGLFLWFAFFAKWPSRQGPLDKVFE